MYLFITFLGILSSFSLLILNSINPIIRLTFLISVFLSAASLFLFFDFYFLGLTYIIVYVGAIAILFLFIIMMSDSPSYFTSYSFPFSHSFFLSGLFLFFGLFFYTAPFFSSDFFQFFLSLPSIDFLSFTDIQLFGHLLYLTFPLSILFLGLLLFITLIGILRISTH